MYLDFFNNILLQPNVEIFFSVVLTLYFSKIIISFLIVELIWPTNFFNRRHTNTTLKKHFRGYTEFFQKYFFLQKRKHIFFKKLYRIFVSDIRVK